MQSNLLTLASHILSSDNSFGKINQNSKAYTEFTYILCNIEHLDECLQNLSHSDQYLFVYSKVMLKLILQEQFCYIQDTDPNRTKLVEQRSHIYGYVMQVLAKNMIRDNVDDSVVESIIDLVGLILKKNCQITNSLTYLQTITKKFFPLYKLSNQAIQSNTRYLKVLHKRMKNNFSHYCILVKIFISMMKYIKSNDQSKDNYKYLNHLRLFKNQYLIYLLKFTVQHMKALDLNDQKQQVVLSLQLLSQIFTYPFNNQLKNTQSSCIVEFPIYFIPVITDTYFTQQLIDLFVNTMKGPILQNSQQNNYEECKKLRKTQQKMQAQLQHEEQKQIILYLLKIFGKIICPTNKLFCGQDQNKQNSIQVAYYIIYNICFQTVCFREQYLLSILQNIQKFIQMKYLNHLSYDQMEEIQGQITRDNDCIKRGDVINNIFDLFQKIVKYSQIVIEQGRNNPLTKMFEILANVSFEQGQQKMQHKFQKQTYRLILKAYQRFTLIKEGQIRIQPNNEVKNLIKFYSPIRKLIKKNPQKFILCSYIQNFNVLSPSAKTILFHLCSQVLIEPYATQIQAILITRYYQQALSIQSVAAIKFIRTLLEQLMMWFQEGVSKTDLWLDIQMYIGSSFKDLLFDIINLCINQFNSKYPFIVKSSLELFSFIYSSLKKDKVFFIQFNMSINNKIIENQDRLFIYMQQPLRRKMLFNVICLLIKNETKIEQLNMIYQKIRRNLCIIDYLYELTGFIEPIDDYDSFLVIMQLCINDLTICFNKYINETNIIQFLDIIYQLFNSITHNIAKKLNFRKHNLISIKIYQFMHPYVCMLAQTKRNTSDKLVPILTNMVSILHPSYSLIDFTELYLQKKNVNCVGLDELVRIYFANIQRVGSITWIYRLIGQNLLYMKLWWQEAIVRKLKPSTNLKDVVNSKFWKDQEERKQLAALIYQIASYDPIYWSVNEESKQQFVERFQL